MAAIAQVVESFAFGTAKSVMQLCDFTRQTHEITVFHGNRPGTEIDLSQIDSSLSLVPLPGRGPSKHLQNIKFLRRFFKDHKFDLVHGHSSYGGLYAKFAAPAWNIKTLYSPRGYSFLREDFPRIARSAFRTVERMTANRCVTVCCGPYEHRVAQELGGETLRINNGFSVQPPPSLSEIDDVVLGVGRICFQKGFDRFRDIAAACPEIPFEWIGDADEGADLATRDLPSNLRLRNYLPHAEALARLRSARMLLLPSRWEGLSRILIEGVCLGKAIVTSRFPGNLDCLKPDGTSGNYSNGFACDDIESYCEAIRKLANDDALLTRMQDASHELAREQFDIDVIAQQWRELYASYG